MSSSSHVECLYNEIARLRGERDAARADVVKLKRDIDASATELQLKTSKIEELENRTRQLKTTIRVQSDQIAGPREVNTPHRGKLNTRYPPAVYVQPPPAFNGEPSSMPPQVGGFPRSVMFRRQDAPVERADRVERFERPRAHFQQGPATQNTHAPIIHQAQNVLSTRDPNAYGHETRPRSDNMVVPHRHRAVQASNWRIAEIEAPMQPDLSGNMGALIIQGDSSPQVEWSAEFTQFFRLTEEWARNYANVPDRKVDESLSQSLIGAFARLSDDSLVMPLLASGSSRYFLIAKLINSYISSDLFRPQAVRGYSIMYDDKITDLRHQIQPDIPSHFRHALMVAIADTAKEMRDMHGFQKYMEEQAAAKMRILWDRLTALFAPGLMESQAWDDLQHIFNEGYRISILMMCTPLSYSFSYPAVRLNAYFNPSCMLNRDVHYKGDPMSLKRQALRVRLGVTPIVVVTNFMNISITPQTVHFANVLLMR